jgi:hypothetical protein
MTDFATLLPGEWEVRATNFPMWLTGKKLTPQFVYKVASTDPLVLYDAVNYRTPTGSTKYIVGKDTLVGETSSGVAVGCSRSSSVGGASSSSMAPTCSCSSSTRRWLPPRDAT